MKLHEYQSKHIFAKYGVPIPRGHVGSTAGEVKHLAEELGNRVVIRQRRWWADVARQAAFAWPHPPKKPKNWLPTSWHGTEKPAYAQDFGG